MRARLFALCLLLAACSSMGQRTEEPNVTASPQSGAESRGDAGFLVIPLRFASARELAFMLRDMIDASEAAIVADERTNSLIVRSSDQRRAVIASLVKSLDVPVTDP